MNFQQHLSSHPLSTTRPALWMFGVALLWVAAVGGCQTLTNKSKPSAEKLDPREIARIAAADPFPSAHEPPPRTVVR